VIKCVALAITLVLGSSCVSAPASGDATPALEFANGRWYDGESFVSRTVWTTGGRITYSRPRNVTRVVDLGGRFVTPPFGEAHNHNLISKSLVEAMVPRYLDDGVFYSKMQSSLPLYMPEIAGLLNNARSVDVVFAHGPLTGTGGHPVALRQRLLNQGVYPGFTRQTLDNQGYVILDTPQDIEQKWPIILGYNPDFIKAILVSSEEYQRRKDDTTYFGRKGLNPELLPEVARRTHAAGMRLSVHTTTAADFGAAVAAGADEIAHMPGYLSPERIRPEDARMAASRGVVVVTTASLALRRREPAEVYEQIRAGQRENLRLLHSSGVRIAIGSDDVEQTSHGEMDYLRGLGVFDNQTLLRMWTTNTAQTIFPSRKVGSLAEGSEASFLVLEGNPVSDFDFTKRIHLRVRDGMILPFPQ
jgi:imidazolonepropionase-like amidohydrolase